MDSGESDMNHPYTGLHGTVRCYPYTGDGTGKHDFTGTVLSVCQAGSSAEEGGTAYLAVVVLRDVPSPDGRVHGECDAYHFVPDDPTEARRRLEAAGAPTLTVNAPTPDYEAVGRGIVKQLAADGMLGGGDIPGWRIIASLGEAIGRGIASVRGGGA